MLHVREGYSRVGIKIIWLHFIHSFILLNMIRGQQASRVTNDHPAHAVIRQNGSFPEFFFCLMPLCLPLRAAIDLLGALLRIVRTTTKMMIMIAMITIDVTTTIPSAVTRPLVQRRGGRRDIEASLGGERRVKAASMRVRAVGVTAPTGERMHGVHVCEGRGRRVEELLHQHEGPGHGRRGARLDEQVLIGAAAGVRVLLPCPRNAAAGGRVWVRAEEAAVEAESTDAAAMRGRGAMGTFAASVRA